MKFCKYALIMAAAMLCACSAKTSNVPLKTTFDDLVRKAAFENARTENLLEDDAAERHGMSKSSIAEGYVYYDASSSNADKIILVRAKNDEALEKVERALQSEKTRLFDALEQDKAQSGKADNIITQTYNRDSVLIISDDAKEILKAFEKTAKPPKS